MSKFKGHNRIKSIKEQLSVSKELDDSVLTPLVLPAHSPIDETAQEDFNSDPK